VNDYLVFIHLVKRQLKI